MTSEQRKKLQEAINDTDIYEIIERARRQGKRKNTDNFIRFYNEEKRQFNSIDSGVYYTKNNLNENSVIYFVLPHKELKPTESNILWNGNNELSEEALTKKYENLKKETN